jgi:uroporphyrinogen-III synthase
MRRVLVLRPEPGASATVERARQRGLDALAVPLFKIEPVGWQAPDIGGLDGLLLTSANAVRCAGKQLESLRGLPAYAVGEATAEAAREEGFDIAATGDSGVDRLLDSIDPDLGLLHLCGQDRRAPQNARQRIAPLVVYRAVAIEAPELPDCGVALIYSPRAAKRLAELVSDRGNIAIAAISEAAADAAGSGWQSVEAADQPNDEALLALAERLCNNLPR